MEISRRKLVGAMPFFVALCAGDPEAAWGAQSAQAQAEGQPAGAMIKSAIMPFDSLPVKKGATSESRAIVDGELYTGQHFEVHETTLQPGGAPHPPHQHAHEEMFLMVKGQLEVTIAGKTQAIGPGGVAFVASGQMHGVRNASDAETQYFVVAPGLG